MSATAAIQVVGVKDALATLNKIDKKTRRQITKDYATIVQPLVDDAKQLVPKDAPLSGFNRSWTPSGSNEAVLPYTGRSTASRAPRKPGKREMNYSSGRKQMVKWMLWEAGIKAYVSGKKPITVGGYTRNLSAFGVRWQGPAAVLFDTAGQSSTPQGAQMIAALSSKFGKPSRVMWRAYERSDIQIQHRMDDLVKRIMRDAQQAIKRSGGVF